MSELKMPKCVWCGEMILASEGAIKFPCPNCGEFVIWRCKKCRQLGCPWECPKCGFTGP